MHTYVRTAICADFYTWAHCASFHRNTVLMSACLIGFGPGDEGLSALAWLLFRTGSVTVRTPVSCRCQPAALPITAMTPNRAPLIPYLNPVASLRILQQPCPTFHLTHPSTTFFNCFLSLPIHIRSSDLTSSHHYHPLPSTTIHHHHLPQASSR